MLSLDINDERVLVDVGYKAEGSISIAEFKNEKGEPLTLVRLCKNLDECDIENISKIIMDLGKEKPFPDIAAN